MDSQDPDFRQHLSSLKRGLKGLSLLNERGRLTIAEFARELGVPRTTAHRVLETLVAEGYAERIPYQQGYRLTPKICSFGSGFSDENWVAHVGSPLLFRETKRIKWPLFIATRSGEYMEVQVSTDQESPHAVDHFRCGEKFPIVYYNTGMYSSSGQVMLAFSFPKERREILGLLRKSDVRAQSLAEEDSYTKAVLSKARALGYAPSSYSDHNFAGLSVPIFVDGRVTASLMMTYIDSAVPDTQLTDDFVPALKSLAGEIGQSVERLKYREHAHAG